ncbi:agmatinase [Albidovulum sediminis]|uniref:Agmatinase n=1 Tax=Albidovulum sediminis TaxID=3066345 RepID=A0ABT2NIZ9_9RHOB|nr:agmatinase [Defluviimonas sediminis]MCT8328710.1 agmatinase [Defluviimonas sediminis]
MSDTFFTPVSGMDLPRFAGIPTFMRLPHVPADHPRAGDVQIGLVGLPWDGSVSNRPGARHGPRALRDASTMIRAQNGATGVRPFELARCADLGDVGPNPVDGPDTLERFESFFAGLKARGVRPLSGGGDHLCTLPVLRGIARDAPLGLLHFDSHTDLYPAYFGGKTLTHGNPFRNAVEEGLLDPARMIQIGIRGTTYDNIDIDFARANGIRIIRIEEFHARGVADVMAEAREIVGSAPAYLSYDIDFVDPAVAPGTGTPEWGGPNAFQAIEVLRQARGLKIVGADLVEVSPPFDASGNTAWLGASLMFEILCLMAEAL